MDFAPPHQPREAQRVSFAVGALFTQAPEDDGAVRRAACSDDTPPSRKKIKRRRQVSLRGDQGGPVYDQAVGRHLARQALKGVSLSLDFHAANVAIDDRDIDARGPVGQPQLFENEGVGALLRVDQKPAQGGGPQIHVSQPRRHGLV